MAHPPGPPFRNKLYASYAVRSARRRVCGDLPSAVPFCYTESKFGETVNFKVRSFDNETGSFDLTGSGLHSISGWKSLSPRVVQSHVDFHTAPLCRFVRAVLCFDASALSLAV